MVTRRHCVFAKADGETPPQVLAKLERMRALTEQLSGWYEQMRHIPRPVLLKLLGMGAKITALVSR